MSRERKNLKQLFLAVKSAIFCLLLFSCAHEIVGEPSWYISPKQNDSETLYGISVGANLEEATKGALADAAARLMVSVSSETTLLREENNNNASEEMRQQVKQNIEKIDFTNFEVSRSKKVGEEIFVEIEIERAPFIRDQKEKIIFAEKQVTDLEKNLPTSNIIQKRVSLSKILTLEKQIELSSRILAGAGENINLTEKLERFASFQNQFNQLTDKIEFYFAINSTKEISDIIRTALNKEQIKISTTRGGSNQIAIAIKSSSEDGEIYGSYMTKLRIDFQNISEGKVIASNAVEVTGSSVVSTKEARAAALKALEEKISSEGILKVIGIIN